MTMVEFLQAPPQFLFFTGKGGVGKTSVACATAVDLASQGKRILLVSTDPASNVGQVFGQRIGNAITPIDTVHGLDGLEIDPEAAAEEYRTKALAPVKEFLSDKDLASVTEQLSGSCTTEIASFNEFTALLTDAEVTGTYDHIIFDTAPTGHTVRLLKLPGEWSAFLAKGAGDASCLGPMSGLDRSHSTYDKALKVMADPSATRLVLVARAQTSSLAETSRTLSELNETGISATNLVVNGVLPPGSNDPLAVALRADEASVLEQMPRNLAGLARDTLALRGRDMVGLDALKQLLADSADVAQQSSAVTPEPVDVPLARLVGELATKDHGLVMLMGKGGVGKTTMAGALAVALAHRGKDVLPTTTDPAAHVSWTVEGATNLELARIDPDEATARYREHVMTTKGAGLDDDGRAGLAEDLRSPCTEEVAVFQAFSQAVAQADKRFVIMDTAPTGHTLLLMDATGSYHREVLRNNPELADATPLMRLQDAEQTSIIVVTLPETTPVLEAEGLTRDLARANIRPWAWIVNRSLSSARTNDPLLAQRAHAEQAPMARVRELASRLAVVPQLAQAPVGEGLVSKLSQ